MHVLFVLSFIIERVGSKIKPYIGALSTYLSVLWQQSEIFNMLRCAIVSTLIHLEKVNIYMDICRLISDSIFINRLFKHCLPFKALGSDSVTLEPLVVNVVALSCDINQEGHVYLLDDGLELWLALLENSPALTPGISSLFRNMPPLLG